MKLPRASRLLLLIIPLAMPGSSLSAPRYVEARFFEFRPSKCRISFSGQPDSSCSQGVISVAANNASSVNISVFSEIGLWQLVVSDGDSALPSINAILIRLSKSLEQREPDPDFYYDTASIAKGSCTPIFIGPRTSIRCKASMTDGKRLDVSFETDNLRPSQNVERTF